MEESGKVLEFCDPRIQNIKKTLEDMFDIDITHHSLYFFARERKKEENQ
jgi:Fur family ferric uptake transcriptional regulator